MLAAASLHAGVVPRSAQAQFSRPAQCQRGGRAHFVVRAAGIPPINFAGQIPPFPNPNQGIHSVDDVIARHPKWQWKEGEHGPVLQRHLSTNHDAKKGHEVLEALQTELYQTNHKGCQIKRESQAKYTMCCEGVEVLLNESRKDMLIDVAIAQQPDPTELVEVEATLRKVEGVLKKHLRHD